MSTLLAWPENLLGLPRLQASLMNEAPITRTTLGEAFARQVPNGTVETKRIKITFTFTDLQYALFQSWVKFKLNKGADNFTMNLMLGNGLQNYTFNLINGDYSSNITADNVIWEASCSLETRNPEIMTEAALNALIV